jgi:hypothetical protein
MRNRLVVAIAAVLAGLAGMAGTAGSAGAGGAERGGMNERHALFSQLLGEHVEAGRVDYTALCRDPRLATYCARLSTIDPDTIDHEKARLAFWIDAYNALTLKVICDNYPVKSINDLSRGGDAGTVQGIWDRALFVVGGKKLSLNRIEHEIIRPRFNDPRIHFALVCAARSCAPLRSEAYEGASVDGQLDDQGRAFFSDATKNRFDVKKKVAYLSRILEWYASDFGDGSEQVLLAIVRFLPAEVAADIRSRPGAWRIEYVEYDWSLND